MDIGPRTTSIRSIASTGGIQFMPRPSEVPPLSVTWLVFWRRPSIRIRTWLDSMPRMEISPLSPPMMLTPSTLRTASASERNCLFSSSSRVMTEILAGASRTSWLKPEAVTTVEPTSSGAALAVAPEGCSSSSAQTAVRGRPRLTSAVKIARGLRAKGEGATVLRRWQFINSVPGILAIAQMKIISCLSCVSCLRMLPAQPDRNLTSPC